MAGHSLLKVIIGFAWSMLLLDGIQAFSFNPLMGLELGDAFIQTYVFKTILISCDTLH